MRAGDVVVAAGYISSSVDGDWKDSSAEYESGMLGGWRGSGQKYAWLVL